MRYYNKDLPEENEYVLVKLKKITEHNFVLVELIEYDNIEGMILFSEVHHRKINIDKLFRNNIQVCIVTDVDINKRHINLSYKKVLPEDRQFYIDSIQNLDKFIDLFRDLQLLYNKHYGIMIDNRHNKTIDNTIYQTIMWNMFNRAKRDLFVDLNNIYRNILECPESLFDNVDLSGDFKELCINNLKNRISYTDMQIAVYFDLTILDSDAINIIKNILHTDEKNWMYECVSSPKYRIIITTNNKQQIDDIVDMVKIELENKVKNINCVFKLNNERDVLKDIIYTIKPLFNY